MTDRIQCEYCKTYLANKASLKIHQKKAKYCLKLRGKKIRKKHKCTYCKASFTYKESRDRHFTTCKEKVIFERKEQEQKEKETAVLQAQLNIYKELHGDSNNCVKEIAKQPRKVTNKVKNVMNLQPLILDQVEFPNPTLKDILKGGKGYANLVTKPLEKLLICTDLARFIFKFMDEQGQLVTDPKLINLTPKIFKKLIPLSREIIEQYKKEHKVDAEEINFNRHIILSSLSAELNMMSKGELNDLHREFIKELAPRMISQK